MRHLWLFLALTSVGWAQTTMEITSYPPSAIIVVDREIRGGGHILIEVTPGEHLVRVSAGPDWQTWSKTVTAAPNQVTPLQVRLEPGSHRLIQLARDLLAKNQLGAAEALLEKASHVPHQIEPYWWIGVTQFKSGNYNEAVAALREYAQFMTTWPDLYLVLGLAHERAGRRAEAFTAYKKALALSPSLVHALDGLSAATEPTISKLGHPTEPVGQLRLAQLLMLKGRLPEALSYARAAADQLYPGWSARDWTQLEPRLPPPPPEPKLVDPPSEGH